MQYARVLSGTPKELKEDTKKKVGRPFGGIHRSVNIQIKLTEEERDIANSRAKLKGTTVSDWLRGILTADEPLPEEAVTIILKNNPCYLTHDQAKDLYKQLTKVLIGE